MNVTRKELRKYVEANYSSLLLEVMQKRMEQTLDALNSREYSKQELRKIILENNELIGSCAYNLMCGAELIEEKLKETKL